MFDKKQLLIVILVAIAFAMTTVVKEVFAISCPGADPICRYDPETETCYLHMAVCIEDSYHCSYGWFLFYRPAEEQGWTNVSINPEVQDCDEDCTGYGAYVNGIECGITYNYMIFCFGDLQSYLSGQFYCPPPPTPTLTPTPTQTP
jgi:hypothetical protein